MQLAYLVTHAELLPLLSLQRLEAMLDASPPPPPPTADDLAAAEAAVQAELQRLQRLWLDQPTSAAPECAGEPTVLNPAARLSAGDTAFVADLGPEIADALARAYADIPARTQALQGVVTASLVPALAALPGTLPARTGPLDAAGVAAWLDLHDAGDPALEQLMAGACTLARPPG